MLYATKGTIRMSVRSVPVAWSIVRVDRASSAEIGAPVLGYFRNVAKLIARPFQQEPPEGYETYPNIRKAAQNVQWDELLNSGTVICGNPAACIRQIEDLQKKYGFTQILCWTRLSGLENRKVLRSMELLQTHVIPHFKRQAQERSPRAMA